MIQAYTHFLEEFEAVIPTQTDITLEKYLVTLRHSTGQALTQTLCSIVIPMTKFVRQGNCGIEDIDRWTKFHKAYVGRFHFRNIRQKDVYYGAPYLTKDKGYCISTESVWDNGRLLSADEYSCTLNDIDFGIVKGEYVWDSVELTDFYTAGYSYLQNIEIW